MSSASVKISQLTRTEPPYQENVLTSTEKSQSHAQICVAVVLKKTFTLFGKQRSPTLLPKLIQYFGVP